MKQSNTTEVINKLLIFVFCGLFFTSVYASNCRSETGFLISTNPMHPSVEKKGTVLAVDSIRKDHIKLLMNSVYRYKMKGRRNGNIMYINIKLDDSGNLFLWISIRSKDSAWSFPAVNKSKYYVEANCLIEDELYRIDNKKIGNRLTKYKIRKNKLVRVSAKSPYKETIEYERVGRQVYRIVSN